MTLFAASLAQDAQHQSIVPSVRLACNGTFVDLDSARTPYCACSDQG